MTFTAPLAGRFRFISSFGLVALALLAAQVLIAVLLINKLIELV